MQETADSTGEFPSEGAGTACGDQEVPFHPSASSPAGPDPVASQEPGETHDTEVSAVTPAAVGCADQTVPFHVST